MTAKQQQLYVTTDRLRVTPIGKKSLNERSFFSHANLLLYLHSRATAAALADGCRYVFAGEKQQQQHQ